LETDSQYTLELEHTVVFEKNLEAYLDPSVNFIVNEGGTRSSKTHSIAKLLIYLSITLFTNYIITVVRKSMPTLRITAMRDFFEILSDNGLYDERYHNKTEHTYKIKTNTFEFISMDDPQKKRGAKRNILWENEANELTLEDHRQLNQRTSDKVFFDYNPSEIDHWIYDKILTRKNSRLIHSTYKDNPFLPQRIVDEIENFINEDETYHKIYALGQRAASPNIIYRNWSLIDLFPDNPIDTIYGLDFGFNHPMVFHRVGILEKGYAIDEMFHKKGWLIKDVLNYFRDNGISKSAYIFADSARPDSIKEISDAGYNIHGAIKSVKDGIDHVKREKLYFTKNSVDAIRQYRHYRWKTDKAGNNIDEPVKIEDDAPDCDRYAIYTYAIMSTNPAAGTTEENQEEEYTSLTQIMGIKK